VGVGLQEQVPAEFTVQLEPAGQTPPQVGAWLSVHAIGTLTQSHSPAVFGLQAWLTGQAPPQAGKPLVWQG
jgi:hypothetical protein